MHKIARGLIFSSLVVSDGLESTFSGLKKKKKKPVSIGDTYSEQTCVCMYLYVVSSYKL